MVEESGRAVGGRRDGVLEESHMGNETGEVTVCASLLGQLSPYREFQNSQEFVERFCLNTTAKTLT